MFLKDEIFFIYKTIFFNRNYPELLVLNTTLFFLIKLATEYIINYSIVKF